MTPSRFVAAGVSILAFGALAAAAETKSYPAGDAAAIEVRHGIALVYTKGPASISVETPEGDYSDIQIETENGAIKISRVSMEKRRFGRSPSLRVRRDGGEQTVTVNGKDVPFYTVRVSLPEVTRLKAAQSSSIRAAKLNTGALDLNASTSSKIIVSGSAGATVMDASTSATLDASDLVVSGLTLEASTSGEAKAKTRSAAPVSVTASTSADAEVVLIDAAPVTASASTSGTLVLSGPCTSATLDSSTSGDLNASALQCDSVNADASTSGDVQAYAKTSIIATASTSGDISVRGTPATRTVKETTSGSVSLTP